MAAYVCAAHSAGPLLLGVSVLGDNGPYTLGMTAGINNKLPFGVIPASLAGLGVHGGGADPKPRPRSRAIALGVHAQAGCLQH